MQHQEVKQASCSFNKGWSKIIKVNTQLSFISLETCNTSLRDDATHNHEEAGEEAVSKSFPSIFIFHISRFLNTFRETHWAF